MTEINLDYLIIGEKETVKKHFCTIEEFLEFYRKVHPPRKSVWQRLKGWLRRNKP